ncbi:zinc finger protein 468-like [Ostrinia furnacalis]|uniref:zinc finger protein 468-like n=1 Tax=Ostrinia furnacalis TaxID=93504 RepID=UPI00103EC648|nr:zinc finger protein 468-like [Ostrinia furnacalis]
MVVASQEDFCKRVVFLWRRLKDLPLDDQLDPPPESPLPRSRGRPKKDPSKIKPRVARGRRTANTGGVPGDDSNMEEYVNIITLSREEQFQEIENRKTSSNYLNSVFKCEHCYKGFIDGKAWKHHLSRHEPKPGDVECEICKFRFKSKRHLSKHVALHEKKYACKACPYVSKCTTQAKQHQRWHKGVTYKCQHCDEILSKWTSYLSHVRLKHPSEFICGACGYSFVSRLGLSMHRTMMHKDAEPEEAEGDSTEGGYCALCDVKFSSMEAYRRHMVTSAKHTQDQDFKNGCRECGETFTSEEQFRAHHRRQHARKRPKNYGKKPCPFTFPTLCPHVSTR